MDEDQNLIQRYGGHVALLLVGLLLLIGARAFGAGDQLELAGAESETPVAAPSADDAIAGGDLVDGGSLEQAFDLSNVPILVDNSLSPDFNPNTYQGIRPEHNLITYTVEPLDTPIGIAEQFGIATETLLGGNAFLSEEASALQPGMTLAILPIDGVLHDVREGDTLEGLSDLYSIPIEDIVAYEPNRLEFPYRLYPGTQILVPGAVREVFVWAAPSLPSRPSTSDSVGSGIQPLVQGTGTFLWPVSGRRITQNFWYGHQAIDIGLLEGSPVIASDTGTVTWAGWNVYGYGNLIVVNHGNGYETYYAHLSGINVVPGQVVSQGSVIGASGNTGRSSGPHLHFEIRFFNSLLQPLSILR